MALYAAPNCLTPQYATAAGDKFGWAAGLDSRCYPVTWLFNNGAYQFPDSTFKDGWKDAVCFQSTCNQQGAPGPRRGLGWARRRFVVCVQCTCGHPLGVCGAAAACGSQPGQPKASRLAPPRSPSPLPSTHPSHPPPPRRAAGQAVRPHPGLPHQRYPRPAEAHAGPLPGGLHRALPRQRGGLPDARVRAGLRGGGRVPGGQVLLQPGVHRWGVGGRGRRRPTHRCFFDCFWAGGAPSPLPLPQQPQAPKRNPTDPEPHLKPRPQAPAASSG
jgi:hypothetical protein